eukprot:gnl/TRDRNA2_/TRDRNA2_144059_c0_seq1.p1 gnl/TRDRNA2_/TRDRNA2_144059_c0~~gnl/TRDRNA2_/TRDRNA2_144059_c0_seq1.p1  ORF type:complete len:501 (+),score=24.52 gnl/TRDRNA2_/TRDRNA2_144059_c0_seq1:101-1603(+)
MAKINGTHESEPVGVNRGVSFDDRTLSENVNPAQSSPTPVAVNSSSGPTRGSGASPLRSSAPQAVWRQISRVNQGAFTPAPPGTCTPASVALRPVDRDLVGRSSVRLSASASSMPPRQKSRAITPGSRVLLPGRELGHGPRRSSPPPHVIRLTSGVPARASNLSPEPRRETVYERSSSVTVRERARSPSLEPGGIRTPLPSSVPMPVLSGAKSPPPPWRVPTKGVSIPPVSSFSHAHGGNSVSTAPPPAFLRYSPTGIPTPGSAVLKAGWVVKNALHSEGSGCYPNVLPQQGGWPLRPASVVAPPQTSADGHPKTVQGMIRGRGAQPAWAVNLSPRVQPGFLEGSYLHQSPRGPAAVINTWLSPRPVSNPGTATPFPGGPQDVIPIPTMPSFSRQNSTQDLAVPLVSPPGALHEVPYSRSSSVGPVRPGAESHHATATTQGKLRAWLGAIPTPAVPDRQWDDNQICKIASFARERGLDHLRAEEIYERYVIHQLDLAETD